ncbi:MAG TPA: hypothetical protein PLA94_24335, partial [Myxococcota bacterium]|nr:hypothetical protein [Myxococcota bacterium]
MGWTFLWLTHALAQDAGTPSENPAPPQNPPPTEGSPPEGSPPEGSPPPGGMSAEDLAAIEAALA